MADLRVIDGDGPGKEERDRERDREWSRSEFSSAIREVAANMLRIIRGAGKPHELLFQMKMANRQRHQISGAPQPLALRRDLK